MAKLNRTCGICRKKYSYCPSCAADSNKPTWMAIFCCENCRNIYNTINDYQYKILSKEDAFNKLKLLDLSCADSLPEYFKTLLTEILVKETNTKEIRVIDNKEVSNKLDDKSEQEIKVIKKSRAKKKVQDIE